MFERGIAPWPSLPVLRIGPLGFIVASGFGIVPGKQPVREAVAVADDPGGVGVLAHVLLMNAVMLDGVVDHAADESDVGSRTQFGEHVSNRAGAIETRVDVQDICAAL